MKTGNPNFILHFNLLKDQLLKTISLEYYSRVKMEIEELFYVKLEKKNLH